MPKLASPAWLPGATSPLEANLHRPMDRRETQWVPLWMFQSLAATPVIFAPPAVQRRNIKRTHQNTHVLVCDDAVACNMLQTPTTCCITKHAKTSIQQNSIRMQTRRSPAFPLTQKHLLQTEGTVKTRGDIGENTESPIGDMSKTESIPMLWEKVKDLKPEIILDLETALREHGAHRQS